jgi:pimeloyl-ACP methyl ester carboxylesterase
MNRLGLISALAVSLVASVAFSEPMSQEMAARTELHSIDTLTLSDAQFLGGDANAKATTTAGQLRIARGSGRLPLVVLQHGSGGMAGNVEMWERELNAIGVSTFALDGFKMWNRSGIEFAAYIPFYPDCATTFVSDTDVADGPIRIFGGTRDDYNPIALCKAYVERLKAAGRDVQLTEYPDAPHAFDNPFGPVPAAVASNAQTVRHCVIREEPTGLLINASTRQGFTYKDPCVELNPHVGHDAAATEAAKTSVKTILKTAFKL